MDDMNKVFEIALLIAIEAHRGQVDKNGVAYILHPIAVANKVNTLKLKTIAVLHDVIEDTNVTAEYLLEKGIPKEIVDVVVLLSKPEDEEYESYIRRVKEDPDAKAVKLADLEHNTDPERATHDAHTRERQAKYEKAKEILMS